jgi:hypothetical protein
VDSQPNHKSSPHSELKKQQILQKTIMCFTQHGIASNRSGLNTCFITVPAVKVLINPNLIVRVKASVKARSMALDFSRTFQIGLLPTLLRGLIQDFPNELLNAFITGPVNNYARHWLVGRREISLIDYRDSFDEAAWLSIKK